MRTQSMDTSPEAERVLIALLRRKGVSRRFQLAASMSRSIRVPALLVLQQAQPGLTESEAMFLSVERTLGTSLTLELRQTAMQRQILSTFAGIDLAAAFTPVVQTLESMGITCALTGSLARSLYGMQQTHLQVNVLANLDKVDAPFLQELLPAAFYVRAADIQAALKTRSSLTYYHLPSLFSVQVAFPQAYLGETSMLARIHRLILVEGKPAFPVLAPEDVSVLALTEIRQVEAKLASRGRTEEPDDLWNELLGVLKVQGPELDVPAVEQQVSQLGLLPWMQRAFQDAGLL